MLPLLKRIRKTYPQELYLVIPSKKTKETIYQDYGLIHWSSLFDVILQKQGILGVNKVGENYFDKKRQISQSAVVLISWIPGELWPASLVKFAIHFKGLCVIEGPVTHPALRQSLGLTVVSTKPLHSAKLIFESGSEPLKCQFKSHLQYLKGEVLIEPKRVKLRPQFPTQSLLRTEVNARYLLKSLKLISLDMLQQLKYRFERHQCFYKDNILNCIALLAYADGISKFDASKAYLSELQILLQQAYKYQAPLTGKSNLIKEWVAPLIEKIIKQKPIRKENTNFQDMVEGTNLSRLKLALLFFLNTTQIPDIVLHTSIKKKRMLDLKGSFYVNEEVHNIVDLLIFTFFLKKRGHTRFYKHNLRLILRCFYDKKSGVFFQFECKRFIKRLDTLSTEPWLHLIVFILTERFPLNVSIKNNHVYNEPDNNALWQNPPFYIEQSQCAHESKRPYLSTINEDKRSDLLFAVNNKLIVNFQAFAYLVHYHTEGMLQAPYWSSNTLMPMIFETLFFEAILDMVKRSSGYLLTINPWPWGYNKCLTLRHDVDRIPTPKQLNSIQKIHKQYRIKPSWYWLSHRLDKEMIASILRRDEEVSLHALKLRSKKEEIRAIQRAYSARGYAVCGESLHGSGGDFWLGYPSVMSAKKHQLAYTEMNPGIINFPFSQYPVLKKNRQLSVLDGLVSITHNASTDAHSKTRKPDSANFDLVKERLELGWYVNLLNHPDINQDILEKWLASIATDDVIKMSAEEVSEWWKATHNDKHFSAYVQWHSANNIVIYYKSCYLTQDVSLSLYLSRDTFTQVLNNKILVKSSSPFELDNDVYRILFRARVSKKNKWHQILFEW